MNDPGLKSPDGRLAPMAICHVVVDPDTPFNVVLRAVDQAGARCALVTRTAAAGTQEVLGVITERDIARLAYATCQTDGLAGCGKVRSPNWSRLESLPPVTRRGDSGVR